MVAISGEMRYNKSGCDSFGDFGISASKEEQNGGIFETVLAARRFFHFACCNWSLFPCTHYASGASGGG